MTSVTSRALEASPKARISFDLPFQLKLVLLVYQTGLDASQVFFQQQQGNANLDESKGFCL